MSRYQAFLIHLGISLTIFGVLAYLVVKIWYPGFFFYTDGGWQGLRLLLGVDLVLGPLLTLIVFRAGKPGLRFDLSMIGITQATCLLIGAWIVHGQRPIAIAYVDGAFYSVCAESFVEVNEPVPDLSALPGPNPKWVTVAMSKNLDEQGATRLEMLRSGRMLSTLADHYAPFDPADVNAKEAKPIKEIVDRDRDMHALDKWIDQHGGAVTDYEFHTFGGRYALAYLGFDARSKRFVGYLPTPAPT
jgi:hypothetical protein